MWCLVFVLNLENVIGKEDATVHLKHKWTSRKECYKLDAFFNQEISVDEIFKSEVFAVILGNFTYTTIFAYGVTESGKMYTIQGTVENLVSFHWLCQALCPRAEGRRALWRFLI